MKKKTTTPDKPAKKPAKSAKPAKATNLTPKKASAPKAAKPAAKAKAKKPAKAEKIERKATTTAKPAEKPAQNPAAIRTDFKPAKLPAVFHSPDGRGELTITAKAITYTHGLREVIFSPRSAHFFAREYKAGARVIAAGSVGVRRGAQSLVFGPDAPAIVAAVLTAKTEADKAAKNSDAKAK